MIVRRSALVIAVLAALFLPIATQSAVTAVGLPTTTSQTPSDTNWG